MVLPLIFHSCNSNNCDQLSNDYDQSIKVEVNRLEHDIKNASNWMETTSILQENRTMFDHFLHAKQYPSHQILGKRIYRLMQQPSIDTLIDETLEYHYNFDFNIKDFEQALSFVKHHYPSTKTPKVQTIISGFYNDFYYSDSLIVIGLDYFMGLNGTFHPNDIPLYIAKRYSRESMIPVIMSFVSNEYNRVDRKHKSLLAEMINIGKSYYFVSQAMPCVPDSLIIGYTSEEMELVRKNEEIIWANLIENELLYETDHFIKNKFVGESPNVYEISEKCPGRVGAWVGWEIVRSYMENNPSVGFTQMMGENDAHKIFQLSGYKPRSWN